MMACEANTCGCEFANENACKPLGNCSIDMDTGAAMCACSEGYDGVQCQVCKQGYVGHPHCVHCLNGGTWIEAKSQCKCPSNFAGTHCTTCAPGYTGDDCHGGHSSPGTPFIIVVSVFVLSAVVVAVAVFAVLWWRKRRMNGPGYELVGTRGEMEDVEDLEEDVNDAAVI